MAVFLLYDSKLRVQVDYLKRSEDATYFASDFVDAYGPATLRVINYCM